MIKTNRGSAIVATLLVVVLVALLGTAMMHQQSIAIARVQLTTRYYRLYFAAIGAFNQVRRNLEKQLRADSNALKGVSKKTLSLHFPKEIKGQVTLLALGGRLNINGLKYQNNQTVFRRLLELRGANLSDEAVTELIQSINVLGESERSHERLREPNHLMGVRSLAHHAPSRSDLLPIQAALGLVSVSQMRYLPHMTQAIYASLSPLMIALPDNTQIDINAAPSVLLEALSPDLDESTAQTVLAKRAIQPFSSVADFVNFGPLQGKRIPQSVIYDQSQFFLVEIKVKLAEQSLTIYSIVATKPSSQQANSVSVLWQTQATL